MGRYDIIASLRGRTCCLGRGHPSRDRGRHGHITALECLLWSMACGSRCFIVLTVFLSVLGGYGISQGALLPVSAPDSFALLFVEAAGQGPKDLLEISGDPPSLAMVRDASGPLEAPASQTGLRTRRPASPGNGPPVTSESDWLSVSFRGLDSVHIAYSSYTGEAYLDYPRWVALMKNGTGGSEVLASAIFDGPGVYSGTFRHGDLPEGSYGYYIASCGYYYDEIEQEWYIGSCSATCGADTWLDGTVEGSLLFDETLDGDAAGIPEALLGRLVVPEDLSLTLDHIAVGGGPIVAYGTLALLPDAKVSRAEFEIHSAHQFEHLNHGGTFTFASGSEGSSVTASKDVSVLVEADNIRIINTEGLSLGGSEKTGSLVIQGGTLADTWLELSSKADLQILNTVVNCSFDVFKAGKLKADGCLFRGGVTVTEGPCTFSYCEFPFGAALQDSPEVNVIGNVFADPLVFGGAAPLSTNISGNSFVGQIGLNVNPHDPPPVKIPIQSNYYGNESGPTLSWPAFLEHGAYVSPFSFDTAMPLSSGRHRSDTGVFPKIWLNGWVIGQNTLTFGAPVPVVLKRGRETLVSLDVMTSDASVSGVRAFAVFDGVTVPAENNGLVLHRDDRDQRNGRIALFYAMSTFNILLPPTDKETALLELYIDSTGVGGYEGSGAVLKVAEQTLTFEPRPARQMNIVIQPVRLMMPFSSGHYPDGDAALSALKNWIPAMLPLASADLHIWQAPPLIYDGMISMFSTTVMVNNIANMVLLGQGLINTCGWASGGPTIDFVVVVLEKGAMGATVAGLSLPLRRGILFVDESMPVAALHEMGHAMGLYTDTEQYDLFPPCGTPMEGLTAFINEKNKAIMGFRDRILHFPYTTYSWYDQRLRYDVMGNVDPPWIVPGTLTNFNDYFIELLGQEGRDQGQREGAMSGRGITAPGVGLKRIFVTAELLRVDVPPDEVLYLMGSGSVRAADMTSVATHAIEPPPDGTHGSQYYALKAYDAGGALVHERTFAVRVPYTEAFPESFSWVGTFDIPDTTARYTLTSLWTYQVYLDIASPGPVTTEITGCTVEGGKITVAWQASDTRGGKAVRSTLGQPLQHLVIFSGDGGTTWNPYGKLMETTRVEIPTNFLPASDGILCRVLSSDGLASGLAQIGGIHVANRVPVVTIDSPRHGAMAVPGTPWPLIGHGVDIEDGPIAIGVWRSSLDGELDAGEGVVLTPGTHVLTFEVTDSQGAIASAEVTVTVTEMPTIDLELYADALEVTPPGRDPSNRTPVTLKTGSVHGVDLRLENTGTLTRVTMSLYVLPPEGEETLLAREEKEISPLEWACLSIPFTPLVRGTYRLRGVISNSDPEDVDLSNNERTWDFDADTVLAPRFSPPSGHYEGAQRVFLWSDTETCTLRYTTDGSEPGPLNGTEIPNGASVAILENMTLKAIGIMEGMRNSTVSTALYTLDQPLCTPSSPSPVHMAEGVSLDADLSWACDGDGMTYDVYLDTADPPQTRVSTNQAQRTFDPGPLQSNTGYRWKVVARNAGGLEREGPVWRFVTETAGSLQVTLRPQEAADDGAQWKVGGSAWMNSGVVVSGLPAGPCTVIFKEIPGWVTPEPQEVVILEDITVNAEGTYVSMDAPAAGFSASPTSGTAPLEVRFTDQSSGEIGAWAWQFGDGGESSNQNPSHTYTDPGTYTVILTVSGPAGSDTETKAGYITVKSSDCVAARTVNGVMVKDPRGAERVLHTLRQFRDNTLGASAQGPAFLAMVARHSEEVMGILTVNPALSRRLGAFLIRAAQAVEGLTGALVVPYPLLQDLREILSILKIQGSPSLKMDIEKIEGYIDGHSRPISGKGVRLDL